MSFQDIANVVEKIAPNVASMIMGQEGSVIVTLLENIFGVKADRLAKVIENDPNASLKLKELESQNYLASIEDRKNARAREKFYFGKFNKRDWVMDGIAIIVTMGFFTMCILVAITRQDESDHDILYMLIGQLTAGFLIILNYYFGSSK